VQEGAAPFYGRYYVDISAGKSDDIAMLRAILETLPRAERVLDLCGGYGRVARHLARRGMQVTVMDRSETMLAAGREAAAGVGLDMDFLQGEVPGGMDRLPLGWFGLVVCLHYSINEILDGLDELFAGMASVLEEGGVAILHLLPEHTYPRPNKWEPLRLDGNPSDPPPWQVETLVEPIEASGDPVHNLYFRYVPSDPAGSALMTCVRRRAWTPDSIGAAAMRAGLVPVEHRLPFMIFSKPS
jgi:SAM-dependent methyltransferase